MTDIRALQLDNMEQIYFKRNTSYIEFIIFFNDL